MDLLPNTTFAGNDLRSWGIAAAIAAGAFIIIRTVVVLIRRRIATLASRTRTQWDDIVVGILAQTHSAVVLVISLSIGASWLSLSDNARDVISVVATVAVLIQAGIWATAAAMSALDLHMRSRRDDGATITTMNAVSFFVRIVLWSVVLLLALDNMGVDVTALVAGLGVGGIAVALALQNVLGDLFASLTIVLDKPFVNGDFIIVSDLMGAVERVGLKTTRIRSLSGEQLVFSNGDLLSSRIRNFGRMKERRVVFTFGVTYSTPADQLERIPTFVREAIESQDRTRFDRSHFKEYGDSSLIFESVYFMLVPDYNAYMDVQQAVNIALYRVFEAEGVSFAFPTRTVHVVEATEEHERSR